MKRYGATILDEELPEMKAYERTSAPTSPKAAWQNVLAVVGNDSVVIPSELRRVRHAEIPGPVPLRPALLLPTVIEKIE